MGMFDNLHVKENNINLPLPENGYYQTKDLDSNLCEIHIDADGLMTCPDYKGCQHYPVDEVEDLHYRNLERDEFWFYGNDITGYWHEFKAEVRESRIVKLWSYDELLFDAESEDDEEFDALPDVWTGEVVDGSRVTGVIMARHKRLKGGRRIIQNYRNVKCSVAIHPDADGLFKVEIDTRQLRASLYGILKDGNFCVDFQKVHELKTPYLRKGLKNLIGYSIDTRVTNA